MKNRIIGHNLYILPKQIRPTLLTADKNLADKAKCYDFDYIYLPQQSQNQSVCTKDSFTRNLGNNIYLYKKGFHLYIAVYGNAKV